MVPDTIFPPSSGTANLPCYNGSGQEIACSDIGPAYTITVTDADPDALPPGVQQALGQVGQTTAPLTSPLFPVVWYGASAVPGAAAVGWPVAMAAVGGYAGIYVCGANAAVGAGAAMSGVGVPAGAGVCGWVGWGLAWALGD
jgi:hypothetical protein